MKKLPLIGKKKELKKPVSAETIDDHREVVLSKGRKFKYPFQYAKHKLVINTIIIGVIGVVLLSGFGWFQLYKLQSTSDVWYRFTKVIPLPVAKVDGENVRFSDYLMILKSTVAVLEKQEGTYGFGGVGDELRAQYQRQALDNAIELTYGLKLARELKIEISREQILEAQREHRTVDGVERSEESFARIIQLNFGLSVEEYERLLLLSLTRREVAAAIDERAAKVADEVEEILLGNEGRFMECAEALGDKVIFEETGELVSTLNLDGGRALVASGLSVGQRSERFVSRNGDGFYFVKLVAKGDGQVSYVSLRIPFGEFSRRMSALWDEGKVEEYITIRRVEEGGEVKE